MYISPKMGLKIWNLLTDLFDHGQLADNLAVIDGHNHTNGNGVQIPTGGIADGAVTDAKLAAGTITDDKIAAGTITGDKIAAGTITDPNIAAGTITGDKVAASTITDSNLAAATITGDKVAANTITDSNLAAATITGDKIAASTITDTNIASATITSDKFASSALYSVYSIERMVMQASTVVKGMPNEPGEHLLDISSADGLIGGGAATNGSIPWLDPNHLNDNTPAPAHLSTYAVVRMVVLVNAVTPGWNSIFGEVVELNTFPSGTGQSMSYSWTSLASTSTITSPAASNPGVTGTTYTASSAPFVIPSGTQAPWTLGVSIGTTTNQAVGSAVAISIQLYTFQA